MNYPKYSVVRGIKGDLNRDRVFMHIGERVGHSGIQNVLDKMFFANSASDRRKRFILD